MKQDQTYKNIPCNIITGFLGVGKTTTIQALLKNKPASESWAILVNEFGQVGLDASLIEGSVGKDTSSVYIKEIPGGCMCCSTGVPMSIALNQLIKEAKPDRLLIEPTGLGHPKEIIKTLSADNYKGVLTIQNTLTILDARHFKDERYLTSPVFKQQLSVADVFIFNKSDECNAAEKDTALTYLKDQGYEAIQTQDVINGNVPLDLLSKVTPVNTVESKVSVFPFSFTAITPLDSKVEGVKEFDTYQRHFKKQDGFTSWGWIFPTGRPENIFDLNKIEDVFRELASSLVRIKAVIYSQGQCLHGNIQNEDALLKRIEVEKSDALIDSKIEVIAQSDYDFESIEQAIINSRVC